MRSIFLPLVFSALVLASNNPLHTATAGAYHTRTLGNHALGSNPANLGHYGEIMVLGTIQDDSLEIDMPDSLALLENDSNAVATDSVIYYFSIQLVANPDRKLVKNVQKDYQSQFGRDLPTAIIAEESLYKFRVGDFTSRDSVNALRDSIIAAGYSDAWVVTAVDPLPLSEEITPYFTMTVAGLRSDFGNNALYPDWINNQLFGGIDLRESGAKDNFLSIFPTTGLDINFQGGGNWLDVGMGNFAISMVQPQVITNVTVPTAIMNVIFDGVQFDQPQDLSDLSLDLLAVNPLSLAYGRQLQIPALANKVDRFYAGAGVNVLLGLTDIHLESNKLMLSTTSDSILIEGKNTLVSNIDNKKFILGTGFSLDLGIAADVNGQLSVSLALQNLLGSINWPETFTTIHEFSINLLSTDMDDIADYSSAELDSLQESFTTFDTTYASGSSNTAYPTQVVLGGAYRVSPALSVDVAVRQYLDNDYFTGVDPQISVGLEIAATPLFPIFMGVSTGGFHGFSWGGGFSLNLGGFQWNVGFGENGGFFEDAKGLKLATELRLVF